ncbi:unnamed protein product [Caenorhabditis auriculariae]|uniref:ShKT domain-containing protein n=1 Tax=Caenorhabditis auriculariae TaxID=2777116 RepID=A0A8S1HBW4_9PELO|nr:unnamed protein product [Caenorhabditis auriculariae]
MSAGLVILIISFLIVRTTEGKPCENSPGVPCFHLKQFCHAPGYVDYLKENCAPSCGYCKPSVIIKEMN